MVTSEQYSLSFCMCCMCFEFLRPNISIQSSKLFIDARNCCRLNLQALGSSNTTVVENFYVCIEKHVLWKNTQTNNFKVWKKSDSDIPTALILMVSSRPCAFFLQETWLQRMLSPSLTLMWMRLSNKKTTAQIQVSSGTVWNPSIKVSQNSKKRNQKLVAAATSPLLWLEANWTGNQPTSFTINTTFKGHEHRCHIWIWWFGYAQIYQNHLQMFWKCLFYIWMDVDGIFCTSLDFNTFICTVIVHFWGRLRMWITNEASHSIYLAP